MKQKLDHWIYLVALVCVGSIIVLVPFHAFLTVWGSSFVGHYTALRLWEEALLAPAGLAAIYFLIRDKRLRASASTSWLWRLVGLYTVLLAVYGLVAGLRHAVSAKALAYGLLIDLRFLAFFLIVWVVAARGGWLRRSWRWLLMAPATLVITVGLLQRFVLPHDILKHFGYNDHTIAPFETIDHKVQYLRVQSTLRGANLLGAYLIIALSGMAVLLRRYRLIAGLIIGLIVLYASGSRGAWVGAAVALAVLAWLEIPGRRAKQLAAGIFTLVVLVGAGAVLLGRHNSFVQNTVFHTDNHSASSVSSNAAHFSASRAAGRQVLHQPLGHGPGTAGPASIYNSDAPSRIAENYFLQMAQETGWIGLLLFAAIYILTGRQLWLRRADPLARLLFASLLGLTCVALLMHIWADETIAFLWWGLAGIALAPRLYRTDL